ncbi:endonuclease YncB(thermonuclease family) [Azospirillum soli]|nr:endonuclease YncB(thermonuclease family) [Azospirillum soli]
MRGIGLCILLLALAAPAAARDVIRGTVEAVPDGGTVIVAGTRIRLWGIRALGLEQSCADADGRPYPCGRLAALALDRRARGRTVECQVSSARTEGVLVAQCLSGSIDVADLQVLSGLALDHPASSGGHYQSQQATAVRLRRGLWTNPLPWPFDDPAPPPQARPLESRPPEGGRRSRHSAAMETPAPASSSGSAPNRMASGSQSQPLICQSGASSGALAVRSKCLTSASTKPDFR